MTNMKSIVAILLFLSVVFAPTPLVNKRAHADSASLYAYVPTSNTAFYSDEADSSRLILFYLPETYFVRIISETSDYYRVSYLEDTSSSKRVTGFVSRSSVIPVDFIPDVPYLDKKIEVTYYTPSHGEIASGVLSQITISCTYYGDYTENGKTYSYVLRGDNFGYVERPMGFTYVKNTEYERKTHIEEQPTQTATTESKGLTPLQTVFLVLLCLLIPTLAALILRTPKKPDYFDEDD